MINAVKLAALAFPILLVAGSPAAAGSIGGSAALALAGVVAPYSPSLTSDEKKAVAAFFGGKSDHPYPKKIFLTADRVDCRISNVDIAARSCELTFAHATHTVTGREANEIYATEAMAGVPSQGAAGSIFESLATLNCTLDPKQIKQSSGGGADCSYEAPN